MSRNDDSHTPRLMGIASQPPSCFPNGDAGWRIENAPDPKNCSVAYRYAGVGEPQVLVYTAGC